MWNSTDKKKERSRRKEKTKKKNICRQRVGSSSFLLNFLPCLLFTGVYSCLLLKPSAVLPPGPENHYPGSNQGDCSDEQPESGAAFIVICSGVRRWGGLYPDDRY